jgi:hypothetical protein
MSYSNRLVLLAYAQIRRGHTSSSILEKITGKRSRNSLIRNDLQRRVKQLGNGNEPAVLDPPH